MLKRNRKNVVVIIYDKDFEVRKSLAMNWAKNNRKFLGPQTCDVYYLWAASQKDVEDRVFRAKKKHAFQCRIIVRKDLKREEQKSFVVFLQDLFVNQPFGFRLEGIRY